MLKAFDVVKKMSVSEQMNVIEDSDCDESGGVLPLRRQQQSPSCASCQ